MKRGPKRGHFSRSRGLDDFNERFSQHIVQKHIKKALSQQKIVRVLEIGCGEGRVLMELRKLFPTIELHGINKEPWPAMKGSQSLKKTAIAYKIFKAQELKGISLPEIHFYDARQLRFPDNYFDLVISQVSIHYVARKDLLLEEVWRVLKPQGKALLNIDGRSENLPDFMDFETPRFVIYKNNKVYPLRKLIGEVRKKGYGLRYIKQKTRVNLTMIRNTDKKLKLSLAFDELSSFNLNVLNEEKDNWKIYFGYRSVYRI